MYILHLALKTYSNDSIQYDVEINLHSKAGKSQLSLPHGTKNINYERKKKLKTKIRCAQKSR